VAESLLPPVGGLKEKALSLVPGIINSNKKSNVNSKIKKIKFFCIINLVKSYE
jgi:hypothetical protein